MSKKLLAAAVWSALAAIPAVGFAQPAGTDPPVQADPNSESGASYSAVDLLESQVRGTDGQVIAEVEDFVLDSESNQVQYVVLAYGNVAAEDAQYHVIPASQFFVQRDADVVYLQTPLTVDVIKRAPAFPRAQWVNVARRPGLYVGVNQFWTGAGIDVKVGRGFGRQGQINAINVDALNAPGAPRPNPRAVNPPGPAGGPGVGNPPGPAGGPGAGNPPGPAGGPGRGNPPGPAGGPGAGNPPGPAGGPGAGPGGPAGGPGRGPNADGGPNRPGPR